VEAGQTVNATFRRATTSHADKLFLDFSGATFTYADLGCEVDRLARGLHRAGVSPGDRVVTVLDNGPDAVIAWLAINTLGAVNVPVNTAYKGEFLRHQVADAGARVVILEGEYLPRITAVWDGIESLELVMHRGDAVSAESADSDLRITPLDTHRLDSGPLPAPDVALRDLAALIYTAGTTGPSKGCMVSHNYLCDVSRRLAAMANRSPDELNWTPLPLFHIYAIATVLSTMQIGGSASLAPKFSVTGFWPEVERTGAKIVNLLGAMTAMLAHQPDTPEMLRCRGQVRAVLAVPFPQDLKDIWRERFGVKWPGFSTYGQTEAGSMVTAPIDEDVPPGSSGRRNETHDVRIFDEHDVEVPPGVTGEIVVRPLRPHVMFEGYWNRPEATVAAARNYWHHTGDLGRFDEDGYFYFVDRQKDYLRRRGENISSFEVEATLLQHPAVSEAAVHAVFSAVTEDDVKATVVLKPGASLDAEDYCRWAADRLPFFAVPRYIEFRADLPKNPVGRVLKYQLREEGVTPTTWDREQAGLEITRR
jgi:crotonobetaine/carnitine-CoA ligase